MDENRSAEQEKRKHDVKAVEASEIGRAHV